MISSELKTIKIEEIKKARKELDLTQAQLADLSGLSQSYLAKLENEKVDPRASTLNKIIKTLQKQESREIKAKDVMTTPLISVDPYDKVQKAIKKFKENNISQMPVIRNEKIKGGITEKELVKNSFNQSISEKNVRDLMRDPLPMISKNESINNAKNLLKKEIGIIVVSENKPVGIITRTDILSNNK